VKSNLVEYLPSTDGSRRAAILRREDGVFVIEIERQVRGDDLYEPKCFWSRVGRDVTLTDTLERARQLAAEALRMVPS
jgi:hypothetical protein